MSGFSSLNLSRSTWWVKAVLELCFEDLIATYVFPEYPIFPVWGSGWQWAMTEGQRRCLLPTLKSWSGRRTLACMFMSIVDCFLAATTPICTELLSSCDRLGVTKERQKSLNFCCCHFDMIKLFSCPDKSPRQLYTYPCHSLTH